jgi:hypothetical protein
MATQEKQQQTEQIQQKLCTTQQRIQVSHVVH